MRDKFKNLPSWILFIISLLAVSAVLLANGIFRYARFSKCEKKIITSGDISFNSIKELEDGRFVSTDNDPQIIFSPECNVCTVEFEMDSELYTGDIVVYYTESQGEDYSARRRTWAHETEDNKYVAQFSGNYISEIRIDPMVYAGNRFSFSEITLNEGIEPGRCIISSAYTLMIAGFISTVLYAVIEIIKNRI